MAESRDLRYFVAVADRLSFSRAAEDLPLSQSALSEAVRRLDAYLRDPAMPFRLWLRQLASDQLLKSRRHHLHRNREPGTGGLRPGQLNLHQHRHH